MGYSIGMIGKSGSGKLRAPQVNSKTNVKMSRKRQVSWFVHSHNLFYSNFLRKMYNVKTILWPEQQPYIFENRSVELHRVLLSLHIKYEFFFDIHLFADGIFSLGFGNCQSQCSGKRYNRNCK